eukprot:3357947-Rhodomonas_salina.1
MAASRRSCSARLSCNVSADSASGLSCDAIGITLVHKLAVCSLSGPFCLAKTMNSSSDTRSGTTPAACCAAAGWCGDALS